MKLSVMKLTVTALFVLAAALTAHAQVIDVDPADFGLLTVTETFDGAVPAGSGTGLLSVGDALPSGLVVTQAVGFVEAIDLSVCGCGFFLAEAGVINGSSTVPSASAVLGVCGPALVDVVGFELPSPVARVGLYFEASICTLTCVLPITGEVTLEAFGPSGSLGSVTQTANGALDDTLDTWIGLETADGTSSITSIVLSGDCFVLDDLRFDSESAIAPTFFVRGDANSDGSFDISDAVFALSALFTPGGVQPTCFDSADTNDDGQFDISDAVSTLGSLFVVGSAPPPPPHPGCGADPGTDSLDCGAFAPCP